MNRWIDFGHTPHATPLGVAVLRPPQAAEALRLDIRELEAARGGLNSGRGGAARHHETPWISFREAGCVFFFLFFFGVGPPTSAFPTPNLLEPFSTVSFLQPLTIGRKHPAQPASAARVLRPCRARLRHPRLMGS